MIQKFKYTTERDGEGVITAYRSDIANVGTVLITVDRDFNKAPLGKGGKQHPVAGASLTFTSHNAGLMPEVPKGVEVHVQARKGQDSIKRLKERFAAWFSDNAPGHFVESHGMGNWLIVSGATSTGTPLADALESAVEDGTAPTDNEWRELCLTLREGLLEVGVKGCPPGIAAKLIEFDRRVSELMRDD